MKNFIVTGATKGIGFAVTRILLEQGVSVLGTGRSDPSTVDQLSKYPNFTYFQIDLSIANAGTMIYNKAIENFKTIDGIVLNAGIIEPIDTIANVDIQQWKSMMNVNVFSQIELIQHSIKLLRESRASLVFVSSGAATEGYGGWGPYCVSKAAFNIICSSLSKEEELITSVSVRPGVVDTDMQSVIREKGNEAMPTLFHEKFVKLKENEGLLHPDQPAKAIARLALFPISELNGKFVQWDSIDVSDLK